MSSIKETDETRRRLAEKLAKEEEEKAQEKERGSFFGNALPARYLPKPFVPKRAEFLGFKETAVRPPAPRWSTPSSTSSRSPRLDKPRAEGQAYLYFFPMGMTESATIHLADRKSDAAYSLIVHPLTGRVNVVNRFVPTETNEQLDDVGKEVVQ